MSDADDTRWEGFADYQRVGERVAKSVYDAVDAFAAIKARHTENSKIKPELASQARAQIHGPAIRVKIEMESDREAVDLYDEILSRWEGEEGFLEKFDQTQLEHECPDWLEMFVTDIRRGAYELGYLQAGRTVKKEPDDVTERETEDMFDNL